MQPYSLWRPAVSDPGPIGVLSHSYPSLDPLLRAAGLTARLLQERTQNLTRVHRRSVASLARASRCTSLNMKSGVRAVKLPDSANATFHHPELSSLRRENFIWNLKNVPLLEKYLDALGQSRNREIVVEVIQRFKDEILTKLSHFRECINHGDLNDHNILVESSTSASGDTLYRVSGILDFSDMSCGYYVFEAAITITYMMIESKSPVHVGGHVLAGFESVIPLTPVERGALFLLVCGRFCQSLVIAAYSCQLHPENKDYLMITAKTGWKHLQHMFDLGQKAVEEIWFETARSYDSGVPL